MALSDTGCIGMIIEGLILAAGLSSRMGRHKLLDRIDGRSVIQRSVMTLLPICDRVSVITGHGAEAVSRDLEALEQLGKVRTVFNPDFELGMLSSFQVGIGAIERNETTGPQLPLVLMMPGDMPFVRSETCNYLILTARGDVAIHSCSTVYTVTYTVNTVERRNGNKIEDRKLWVPSYRKRAGHPVAFYLDEHLKRHILGASSTETLKSVLAPMMRCFVNVSDPGILQDLDTPEDFQRLVVQGGRP